MKPDISSLPEWSRPWAEHRLCQAFSDISGEQWGGLGDWLTALPTERPKMPAKLHKLTMAQALRASVLWHDDISSRAERIRADQADFGGDPDAVQVLADGGQGWRWVRVTSPEGLDYEGNAMGHCVGSGNYDTGVTIISLRDKDNMPHCTIEWDENSRIVEQVQGRANSPVVEKYHRSVASFVNGLEPLAVHGVGKFGHAFVEGKLIHWSKLPDGLTLEMLDLAGCNGLTHLPDGLIARYIDLEGCTNLTHLPDGLTSEYLNLSGCTGLTHLPYRLSAELIYLSDCTGLTHLPDNLKSKNIHLMGCTGLTQLQNGFTAEYINLVCCTGLTHLPDGLTTKCINLKNCTGLTHLPDELNVEILYLNGCTNIKHLPDKLSVKMLDLRRCTGLTHLPDELSVEILYLNGCTNLKHLPNGLNENCRVFGGDHFVKQFVNAPQRFT